MEKETSRLAPQQIAALCAKRPVRIAEGGMVMTGPVRLTFPSLAKKAKPLTPGGAEKYQAALLFPHGNIGPLMQALRAKVKEHYPKVSDPGVLLDPKNKNSPVKDQGLKVSTADGGLEPVRKTTLGYKTGLPYVNAKSGNAIPCYRAVAGQWVQILPEELEKVMYGGCWVEAKLTMFPSSTSANPGVALGLQGLWLLADDNSFGGGGGASAGEGGDASDVVSIEDPNSNIVPAAAARGATPTAAESVWDD